MEISICISSQGRWEFLQNLLLSIKAQSLSAHQYEILLALPHKQYDWIPRRIEEMVFLNVTTRAFEHLDACVSRNFGIEVAKAPILYFLDEDCSLPTSEHLRNVINYHKVYSKDTAIGGRYINGDLGSSLGQVYNLVCDLWQDRSDFYFEDGRLKHLLGGNLSIKLTPESRLIRFGSEVDFGGEEIAYLKQLQTKKLSARLIQGMSVQHHARHDVKSFFSRAWLHGQNKFYLERENFGSVAKDRNLLFEKKAPMAHKSLAALYVGIVQTAHLVEKFKNEGMTRGGHLLAHLRTTERRLK